jgi:hypothetical protein
MFLGDDGMSGEDNIFFLVHELFTGGFLVKNPTIFYVLRTKKGASQRGARAFATRASNIVIEKEFEWMRTQTQRIMLFALVRDPHLQKVFREDIAL